MQCGKIGVPESLSDEPLLGSFFRDFCSDCLFLDSSHAFPVTLGAAIWKQGVYLKVKCNEIWTNLDKRPPFYGQVKSRFE